MTVLTSVRRTCCFAATIATLPALLALQACDRPPASSAASGPTASGAATAAASASPAPVVTMKQLMEEVFEPTADRYWTAVGSTTDKNGTVEHAPRTPAEWTAVRDAATVLAEAGNLLLMDGRAVDRGDWATYTKEMITMASRARDAAAAHDKQRVFDAGAALYDACTQCHTKYMVPLYPLPPALPPALQPK